MFPQFIELQIREFLNFGRGRLVDFDVIKVFNFSYEPDLKLFSAHLVLGGEEFHRNFSYELTEDEFDRLWFLMTGKKASKQDKEILINDAGMDRWPS